MTITQSTTVAEIASTVPASVRIFQKHGIDFCCGGKTPLAQACRQRGVSFDAVAHAIEASAAEAAADDRDWMRATLQSLTDHIVTTFHNPLREELPRLESMAAKVSSVHGGKAPHLKRLEAIVTELAADLLAHMQKEEAVLFPAIEESERAGAGAPWIASPIDVMKDEHDHAGALLSEMRALTGDYEPPVWACQTFRSLYYGLAELEQTMHVHVHLENNILFPRALGMAGAARQWTS